MEQTGRHSTVDGDATAPLRRRDTTVTALWAAACLARYARVIRRCSESYEIVTAASPHRGQSVTAASPRAQGVHENARTVVSRTTAAVSCSTCPST
jgi:hypothetical protein